VSGTGGKTTSGIPLQVVMDFGIQPMMIGKRLVQE